jgi:hypothetical protein
MKLPLKVTGRGDDAYLIDANKEVIIESSCYASNDEDHEANMRFIARCVNESAALAKLVSQPRFFRETTTGQTWEWRNGVMTRDGDDSIFHSPAEILECLDVIETDQDGNALEPSADNIAAERGDRACKLAKEEAQ